MKKNYPTFFIAGTIWLAIFICFVMVLIFIFQKFEEKNENTLANNGKWNSTKLELEMGVMGAISFFTKPQTLASERLNVGAWHGHQEVFFKKPFAPISIELDFFLAPEAYLNIIFNKNDAEFSGVRLSSNKIFKNKLFIASKAGEFIEEEFLKTPKVQPGRWHHFKLDFKKSRVSGFLNDRNLFQQIKVGSNVNSGVLGFRGSQNKGLIDNLVLVTKDGDTIRENFKNEFNFKQTGLRAFYYAFAVNLIVFFLLYLKRSLLLERLNWLIMCNGVFAVMGGIYIGYLAFGGQYYPELDENLIKKEDYFRNYREKEVISNILDSYKTEVEENVFRILFLGTSQTWGAGALKKDEGFVNKFQNLLNTSSTHTRQSIEDPGEVGKAKGDMEVRFECINSGISASDSTRLLYHFKEKLLSLNPKMVVLNLSANGLDLKKFESSVEEIILLCLKRNIRVVLVLEAESIEVFNKYGLLDKQKIMRDLGQKYKLKVIDMHSYIAKNADKGFIWWDFVHPTSYGHSLIARKLFEEISGQLNNWRITD